jgi:hypothetical protein
MTSDPGPGHAGHGATHRVRLPACAGDDLGRTPRTGFVTGAPLGLSGIDRPRLGLSADGCTFFGVLDVYDAKGGRKGESSTSPDRRASRRARTETTLSASAAG